MENKKKEELKKVFFTDTWEIMYEQGISFGRILDVLRKGFEVIVLNDKGIKVIRIKEKI